MSHQSRPSNGTVFDDASTVNLHRVADTNIVRGGTPLYSFTNLVSLLLENVFNYKRKYKQLTTVLIIIIKKKQVRCGIEIDNI
jgi:hypothetical protein